MKKKGFTLIELLVVLAIVALLMAILMPALHKARGRAKNALCRAYLRRWGVAFACYGYDWDDKVCPALTPTQVGGNWVQLTWVRSLKPYYKKDKILFCPSAKKVLTDAERFSNCKVGSKFGAWRIRIPPLPDQEGSYGINGFAQFPTDHPPWNIPKEDHWGTLSSKNAREIPLLGDCVWREAYPSRWDRPIIREDASFTERDWAQISKGQLNRFVINRHHKAVNLLCLDGSLPHVLLTDLWQFRWSRTFEKKKVTFDWL